MNGGKFIFLDLESFLKMVYGDWDVNLKYCDSEFPLRQKRCTMTVRKKLRHQIWTSPVTTFETFSKLTKNIPKSSSITLKLTNVIESFPIEFSFSQNQIV